MLRRFASLPFLILAALSDAAEYTFVSLPEEGAAKVTVRLKDGESKSFRMPAWAPGDYELFNYGRIVEPIAFRKDGAEVQAKLDPKDINHWIIAAGADEITYRVKPSRGNFSPNLRATADHTFVNGAGVFGWFEGDEKQKQMLFVTTKPGQKVYSTLEPVSEAPEGTAGFEAHDYDEMIDAPFVLGANVRTETVTAGGKPLTIVAFNRHQGANLAEFARIGKLAAESAHRLFGELPYPRYTFYCDFGGGGGGLEHLNSSRLGLGQGASAQGASGLIFHEFFHCFNVKRIRPKNLGPFDYTKPAVTGTLWWLEGVTDYYADVLQVRAGLMTPSRFLAQMSGSMAQFHTTPGRSTISADQASRRVWEARGSWGFGGVSYYQKGALIGLTLDLAIRGLSGGKHSLDDVMRDLYRECKDRKPGYEDARILELCEKYSGSQIGWIYHLSVGKPGDLPIAEAAKLAGFVWDGQSLMADPNAPAEKKRIAAGIPMPLTAG